MHSEKEHIFKVLGGRALLGSTAIEDMDHLTRKRFPYKVVKQMKDSLELSTRMFAKTLSVSESTLARLQKSSGLLSFDASDRLYRIARIYAFACDVLENDKDAKQWINSPQIGLGGKIPIDLLQTDAGTKEVEELLGRIEYGVLS